MKLDLHCHTKAGSIDSKVSLERYIEIFKAKGFGGMMITDHDSYKGCKVWDQLKEDPKYNDFVVIKGVEYDTCDAGHFLVIMPDDVILKVLTIRGMPLRKLIKIVHQHGGILGPAHPYGVRSSSAMFLRALRKNPELIKSFDFVEGFNTCESAHSNIQAINFATKHNLPTLGGSDAHKEEYAGMAYTQVDSEIKSNNDLIYAIMNGYVTDCGGIEREETPGSIRKMSFSGVWGFKIYNGLLGYIFSPYRNYQFFDVLSKDMLGESL